MANKAARVGVDGRDKHGHDGIPTGNAISVLFAEVIERRDAFLMEWERIHMEWERIHG
jgi:hypothetical protein